MDTEGNRTIKNSDALAVTPARTSLLSIAEAGYQAIRTATVIRRAVELSGDILTIQGTPYTLNEYTHLYVLAVGKSSNDAAHELELILGDRISDGVALDVCATSGLKTIRAYAGTHPYPSAENAAYTRHLLDLAERANEHDLVLAVVSGGGSSLLCQPLTHTCMDEAGLVKRLFKGGATIQELNTVRKHLSKARGGYLAVAAHPAQLVTLLFSDVPGNDLHTIASGPTVKDNTTRADARAVLEKYHSEKIGFSPEHLIETPKDPAVFAKTRNELVLTNETALEAMRDRGQELGYTVLIRDTELVGEARDVGAMIVAELRTSKPRTVLLYGGETTVTITGPGKGGRNEELALGALTTLADDELVTSLASDGRDNTDYAGGIADAETRTRAAAQGFKPEDFLYTNDSFTFFHTLQQGVETGYTGSNVADLMIGIKHGDTK